MGEIKPQLRRRQTGERSIVRVLNASLTTLSQEGRTADVGLSDDDADARRTNSYGRQQPHQYVQPVSGLRD
ncbi:hypothetical protein [Salmonella enterica]|uniref:hypothetical protein n=1 Tax=Salmonella enterica TaxID=28901 RepID=UPI001591C9DE|nr:hypothetical protein [Salmonella enterica]